MPAVAASSARVSRSRRARPPPNRSDIEVIFDGLPEPIDLELDTTSRVLYWTDRGDPPRGNTVNRAPVDAKPSSAGNRADAPDGRDRHRAGCPGNDRMFITDLGGTIYSAELDGSDKRELLFAQGNLTGIAYAEV